VDPRARLQYNGFLMRTVRATSREPQTGLGIPEGMLEGAGGDR
jgi:hypothetical protein